MHLEVFSDIACPFCFIGKRHLEAALASFEHADAVQVRWRSFQLAPDAPREIPGTQLEHLARKYGRTLEEAAQMQEQVVRMAAEAGLELHVDRIRMTNTYDAHRVLQLAQDHGLGEAVNEALLGAYFVEGEHLGDHATLTRLAAGAGLDADAVAAALASDAYGDAVRADLELARGFGLQGVPAFVLDRRFGLTGAQPPEVIVQGLRRAWDLRAAA